MLRLRLLITVCLCVTASFVVPASAQDDPRFTIEDGEHVLLIGNTFAERIALSGYFDALIHCAHPSADLFVRSVPWSADEVADRPREHSVPSTEAWLDQYDADVIVMCFGMSESFDGMKNLDAFKTQLVQLIDTYRETQFNNESPPRLILVSPIAHEDLGGPLPTGPAVIERNRILAAYVEAMSTVTTEKNVRFINLFEASKALYREHDESLTGNGIHPNELGCFYFTAAIGRQLGWVTGKKAGSSALADILRRLAYDKHHHERLIYRPTNTEYIWGRRREPYGAVNFPEEIEQLERMVAARETEMQAMGKPTANQLFSNVPTGPAVWETTPSSRDFLEDQWTPTPVIALDLDNALGILDIRSPQDMLESFTLPEGYSIDIFASEEDFEELQNPLAMAFDERGRLWLLCAPTYPHLLPGETPRCCLLILEDTDADGHADKRTVFASQMNIPTGFALDHDGVWVGRAPDLFKLIDTDGDDIADRKIFLHSGFGMPDSHHTISAFAWDPSGGFLMCEGTFMKTNIETPWGIHRTRGAAIWRVDSRTQRPEIISHTGQPNPWGIAFDAYGQAVFDSTSGGAHYDLSQIITNFEFPHKPRNPRAMLNRGRPTAGNEIIRSTHFPEEVQGTHLTTQCIGFHGIRWDRITISGSGMGSQAMPQDLLQSSDTNFRPADVEVGPDGAIYVMDWSNPLIGHMQYSVRDPRRDNTHGRIWRITHDDSPLVAPIDYINATPEELLEILRVPEKNNRHHARRRLQTGDPDAVLPIVMDWVGNLDDDDEQYDRLILEAIWIHQAYGSINLDLLGEVLDADTPEARAAGVRVLRYALQFDHISTRDAGRKLRRLTDDDDMRVRLEVASACGFLRSEDAIDYVEEVAEEEMDDALKIVVEETLQYLRTQDFSEAQEADQSSFLWRMETQAKPTAQVMAMPMTPQVAGVILGRGDFSLEERRDALEQSAGTTLTLKLAS